MRGRSRKRVGTVCESLETRKMLASALTGTLIGTTGSYQNDGNTIANAFDSNLNTFFDAPTGNNEWVGLALTAPATVSQVQYAPRASWANRMVGGIFQGSNDPTFTTGVVNLFTITAAPTAGVFTSAAVTSTATFSYVRYLAPAGSFGNVADLVFDGTPVGTAAPKLTGTVTGTVGSYQNDGNTIANVFDGNLNTFFDGPTGNGNYVQEAFSLPANITQIQYSPRPSWASRMVGGIFEASNDPNFVTGVVNLYTITTAPAVGVFTAVPISTTTAYQYVRYVSPAGSYGNVAEIEFDGTLVTATQPKLTGTIVGTVGSYQNDGNTIANVFDGNLATYFDGPSGTGEYVGLNFSSEADITQIQYAPRPGWASRMVGGIFEASNDPNFVYGVVDLYTITTAPTVGVLTAVPISTTINYEYVRYVAPASSYGNVAEIEFDGSLTGVQPVVLSPSVTSSTPANGATNVSCTSFVSCALNLPNAGAGIDTDTLSTSTVYLYRTFDHTLIPSEVNTDAAGGVIVLQPQSPLAANTSYTFVVTSGLVDNDGGKFTPYTVTFTTGAQTAPADPNIAFQQVALPTATNQEFTCVTMGPDGDLYATTLTGGIFQYPVNADGTLGNPVNLTANDPQCLITGIAFDPSSTPTHMIIWISAGSVIETNAPNWSGMIMTIAVSGTYASPEQDMVIGLPRSNSNHMNDQPVFGPDGALYWCQGSMSSMGAPDSVWGYRPETLLSAAILRLNVQQVEQYVATNNEPLDVQTDDLPAGQTPYYPSANEPLTIYVSGIRNAYDLIWDTNGDLYAPTNGSSAGGNIPATPPGYTPAAPAENNVAQAEDDYLYIAKPGYYYGHPNPARGEYIFGGANPIDPAPNTAIQTAYPLGTNPSPIYPGYAYDFGVHYSPDGSIEYEGSAFGGALNGALLITEYSGGKDVVALTTGSSGQITSSIKGIAGFTGFTDPVDIIENDSNGDLYVDDLGAGTITLLRPIQAGATASVSTSTLDFNAPVNGAPSPSQSITITNTGTQPLAIPATGLSIIGANAASFVVATGPALPAMIPVGGSITLGIVFNPGNSTVGLQTAQLQISSNDPNNPSVLVSLRGLATAGLGGSNEPSLQAILNLLQIPDSDGTINAAQTSLPLPPQTPNDEVVMQELEKAGSGPVTITPLAAFDSSITPAAGFGYYTAGTPDSRTQLFTINSANSQEVEPAVTGLTSFDPGSGEFGIFGCFESFTNLSTGTARISYSEDDLNTYDSTITRKIRFYPLKTASGIVVPNSYVFAIDDSAATPYSYNDLVGIISNVKAAPAAAKIGTENVTGTDTESAPSPASFVFNSVANQSAPLVTHTTDDLRIEDTGSMPLVISSISSSNSVFAVSTPITYPLTIAAGASMDLALTYNPTTDTGTNAIDSGTLTINSNDPITPALSVQMTGIWQSSPGTSTQPALPQIVSSFGYTTTIVNAGQSLNQNGQVTTAGQEVLSTYWERADTNLPVSVQQLASYNSQTTSPTLSWYAQGHNTSFSTIVSAAVDNTQSLLPLENDTTQTPAFSLFTPSGIFGLNVDGSVYSDDTLNAAGAHEMRFYPVYNSSNQLVPNTWLMAMDYPAAPEAYTYTANVYLITNMKPAPAATPSGVTAAGSIAGNTVSWNAVSDPSLAGYQVWRSTTASGTYSLITTTTNTSYLDPSTPGTTYYYTIAAIDNYGTLSGFSSGVSATRTKDLVAPTAPANLNVSLSGSSVTLNWSANTQSDLAGYNVYRSTAANGTYYLLNSTLLIKPTFTDSTATVGNMAFYEVVAVNLSGTQSSPSIISTTIPSTIAPASSVSAAGSSTGVTLTWKASTASKLAGYDISRSNSATGVYTQLNSAPVTSLTYADTTAPVGQTSYYEVTTVTTAAADSVAIMASAFRSDAIAPATPTNFKAAKAATGIQLTWSANTESDLAGYNLYSSTSATGTFVKLNSTPITQLTYNDLTAVVGQKTYYKLTAINTSGLESVAATVSLAI
jgi:fibronectin type 3 domain-containing protein/glucose/arabinose dehydrogenase